MMFEKGVTEILIFYNNYKLPLRFPHTIKMIWFSFQISFKQTNKTEGSLLLGFASAHGQTAGRGWEATVMCMAVVFSATVQVLVHQV